MPPKVGYIGSDGSDLGDRLVPKSYLIDRYPDLANTFRFAGLWLWGENVNGQHGDNTTTNKSSPVQTVSGGANWKQVSPGGSNTAAIKTDGTLWTWGINSSGQLGTNDTTSRSSPVQTVSGGTNWKQVSAGGATAAIKTDGTLWLWGANTNGDLGTNDTTSRSSPVQTVSGGTNWKQVSTSGHVAAIKTDGTLWLWGSNFAGSLGDNTATNKSSPVQTVAGGTNWKQVSCGNSFTAAIKTDGTLWLWGFGNSGRLGTNNLDTVSSPVQTVAGGTNWKQVSCGGMHTAAIKTDGTLWTWGFNGSGRLGDFSTGRSSPAQTVSAGTNWKQVSSGAENTAAIKTDGTLWTWGANFGGQLGINTSSLGVSSPVQTVSAGTNWKQVSCSNKWTVAIRDDSDDYL